MRALTVNPNKIGVSRLLIGDSETEQEISPFVATMTLFELKRELERRGEGPPERFRFVYAGRELIGDSEPLSAFGISQGATIFFVRLPTSWWALGVDR